MQKEIDSCKRQIAWCKDAIKILKSITSIEYSEQYECYLILTTSDFHGRIRQINNEIFIYKNQDDDSKYVFNIMYHQLQDDPMKFIEKTILELEELLQVSQKQIGFYNKIKRKFYNKINSVYNWCIENDIDTDMFIHSLEELANKN